MARGNVLGGALLSLIALMLVEACNAAPQMHAATGAKVVSIRPTHSPLAPVDVFLAACPSEEEIARIDADLKLEFDTDPTKDQPLACRAAQGSRDLTPLQKRTYNTLLVMRELQFTQSLPWTDKQLYAWLVDTIDGIRFNSEIINSFCCAPPNTVNIQTHDLVANTADRWIEPATGLGLRDLLVLFAHEARHNEEKLHTCDKVRDNSLSEMGAWAVQYYLDLWLADFILDKSFFTAQDSDYFALTRLAAREIRGTRFCLELAP